MKARRRGAKTKELEHRNSQAEAVHHDKSWRTCALRKITRKNSEPAPEAPDGLMLVDRLGLSERRASRITGQHRSTQRRLTQVAPDDQALRKRLRISPQASSLGFPPCPRSPAQRGLALNRKRVTRIWREKGLRVPAGPRATSPRQLNGSRQPPQRPVPDHVSALDYRHDASSDGRG